MACFKWIEVHFQRLWFDKESSGKGNMPSPRPSVRAERFFSNFFFKQYVTCYFITRKDQKNKIFYVKIIRRVEGIRITYAFEVRNFFFI